MIFLIGDNLPSCWPNNISARAYMGVVLYDEQSIAQFRDLCPQAKSIQDFKSDAKVITKEFNPGVTNPMVFSLTAALNTTDKKARVDRLIIADTELSDDLVERLRNLWREPAIETLQTRTFGEWSDRYTTPLELPKRVDDSFVASTDPLKDFDLEFSTDELALLHAEADKRGNAWNRAEWEVFAQTWSEHCIHKIFAADVHTKDTLNTHTKALFKEHIYKPTKEIMDREPGRCLSVFVDNAGVLPLKTYDNQDTDWAFCMKMETHNSPSAIAPYGGASTGIVGVHRDILGTGLGAMPVVNWDVLCFESPTHKDPRPDNALHPDVLRSGVIRGIEEGGNQSGIPTTQGSVVFHADYAVKPLVYAGSIGIMPKKWIEKKPKLDLVIYCLGGETGIDGLRGAVMSSRDLRSSDFSGSAVQVANAFVQRRLTDFMLQARDQGLIDDLTDNGAGGLSCSVGEMARATGGAKIDISELRLKYEGILPWERLLSESQERMTLATSQPEKLEELADLWEVGFDKLGVLNNSGFYHVTFQDSGTEKDLIKIPLDLLYEQCPKLSLTADWDTAREVKTIAEKENTLSEKSSNVLEDFATMLDSEHLCSREGIIRRYDHEVQGRTLKVPFGGRTQNSPRDASVIEVYEVDNASFVFAHALAPWRKDVVENTIHSFDEAVRSAVIGGIRLESSGILDNFSWPDPIPSPDNPRGDRKLWRLVRANEVMSEAARAFNLPFISGKDSMKNNSRDFDIPETLVISIGGSSIDPLLIPDSFFSRANDVVFHLPLVGATMRDSAWERIQGVKHDSDRNTLLSDDVAKQHAELKDMFKLLNSRYQALHSCIEQGWIRAAKDISEGGLLMSVFEMCLGREMGMHFVDNCYDDALMMLGEGLGGIILSVDPHNAEKVEAAIKEATRLGVVVNKSELHWPDEQVDWQQWRKNYLNKTNEGFWS